MTVNFIIWHVIVGTYFAVAEILGEDECELNSIWEVY